MKKGHFQNRTQGFYFKKWSLRGAQDRLRRAPGLNTGFTLARLAKGAHFEGARQAGSRIKAMTGMIFMLFSGRHFLIASGR
jgi:hypothetical protein